MKLSVAVQIELPESIRKHKKLIQDILEKQCKETGAILIGWSFVEDEKKKETSNGEN